MIKKSYKDSSKSKGEFHMKKKILCILMTACMVLGMAGCGGTEKSNSAASGENDKQSEQKSNSDAEIIEVWTNNRHDEEYMTKMVDQFNAEHSDIQIKYTIMTDDWANSIQLAYQANTAPDIITMSASDGMTLSDYVNSGMFVSLTEYINGDEEFQKVTEAFEHVYEGLNAVGDDIYWVPNGVRSGTRIEYNKELIQAAGYEKIPETLDELVALCKDVTEKGNGATYGVAFTSSGPFGRWLEGVGEMSGYTHGGYDYKTGTFDFSSWKPLLEAAAKLYTDGSVLPGSESQGVDNSRALFAQGSFAVWGNASQEAGVFTEQFPCSFEWGVAELPTMEGEVKGALNCTPNFAFTMLSSCKNKDAAWEVIKYFSSEEFLKGYFEGGYSAPLSSYMEDIVDESKVGRLADFAIQEYEDVYPTIPAVTVEGDTYPTVFWNVILGNMSADNAIEDLNTRYNEALERGLENGSCQRLVIEDFDALHPSASAGTYVTE